MRLSLLSLVRCYYRMAWPLTHWPCVGSTLIANTTSGSPNAVPTSKTPTATSGSTGSHSSHTGAIVGGVIGGLGAVIVVLAFSGWILRRRRQRHVNPVHQASEQHEKDGRPVDQLEKDGQPVGELESPPTELPVQQGLVPGSMRGNAAELDAR